MFSDFFPVLHNTIYNTRIFQSFKNKFIQSIKLHVNLSQKNKSKNIVILLKTLKDKR